MPNVTFPRQVVSPRPQLYRILCKDLKEALREEVEEEREWKRRRKGGRGGSKRLEKERGEGREKRGMRAKATKKVPPLRTFFRSAGAALTGIPPCKKSRQIAHGLLVIAHLKKIVWTMTDIQQTTNN